jgi:hypothetical protein
LQNPLNRCITLEHKLPYHQYQQAYKTQFAKRHLNVLVITIKFFTKK